ncbi:hypothetical protein IWW50_005312 [Coemansia erecta]|nr:hypothetical protein GGF43_002983 [Coemansia sp. RSA 2618]KAJ2819837.1 hypothetical protein IWW50_005312 [Coemansia erecta]
MYKCAISMLALAATVINAAPVQNIHARKLDVEDVLNQMSSQYNDPAYADRYNSLVLSIASKMLPVGSDPSTDDLYSALASYKEKIGPSLMAEEVKSMDKALENINVNGAAAEQLSDIMSMFHDSSAVSRMAGMVSQLINNVIEDHEAGKPTGSTEDDEDTKSDEAGEISEDGDDDKDTKSDKEDDKDTNSDKEETTSGAASAKAGMLLMSVGAVAGAMAAMF